MILVLVAVWMRMSPVGADAGALGPRWVALLGPFKRCGLLEELHHGEGGRF